MNLNSQIDWSDTDRIVSNDTRYVAFNGDWWRESSTWQTRQNGSPALTRVGLTRTRLTGLANNGDERLANNGEYPPTAQRSPEGAATRGAASSPLIQNGTVLISETRSLDPLGNATISCSYLDWRGGTPRGALPFPGARVVRRDRARELPHALVRRGNGQVALEGSDRPERRAEPVCVLQM